MDSSAGPGYRCGWNTEKAASAVHMGAGHCLILTRDWCYNVAGHNNHLPQVCVVTSSLSDVARIPQGHFVGVIPSTRVSQPSMRLIRTSAGRIDLQLNRIFKKMQKCLALFKGWLIMQAFN